MQPAHAVAEAQAVATILQQTNAYRASKGKPPLIRNARMDGVAAAWSREQCRTDTMSHNPAYARQIPSGWTRAAENVAYGYVYDRVVAAWIASPGHEANLNGDVTHIGIGYCEQGDRRYYTQVFGKYRGALAGDVTDTNRTPSVLAVRGDGTLWRYPMSTGATFGNPVQLGTGWGSMSMVQGAGDITGDGNRDIIARDSSARLWAYPTDGSNGISSRVQIGSGWGSMNMILAPGDLNGDGRPDLLARDATGQLRSYASAGAGRLASGVLIGAGWSKMRHIVAPGDLTSDGIPDLLAIDGAGKLLLYPGVGGGRVRFGGQVGHGWGSFTAILSPGDVTGDGTNDLLGRSASGQLFAYAGDGRGGWASRGQVGNGWNGLSISGPGPVAG